MEFKLRPWSSNDLESVHKHGNNPNIRKFMSDGFPDSEDKWRSFLEMASKDQTIFYRAIQINGEAAGGIGISPQKDYRRINAELGYWLSEDYWGNGIMTKAIVEMVKLSFERFNINRIFATPFENNFASHHCLKKAGFTLEAKFEKNIIKNDVLLDELVYAIRRKDH